jgi:predicted DNA-binding transcriptional regulator AlpA
MNWSIMCAVFANPNWKLECNMTKNVNQNSEDKDKEFLKINDMLKKLGVTRTQFWRMRKAGEVPLPVIKNPQLWLASKVTEFYENRASKQQSS